MAIQLHHPYRELACAVLSRDFGLDVVLPADRLVPMVPQRLNYIHWLEDLLKDDKEGDEREGDERERDKREGEVESKPVFGVDIGESVVDIYLSVRKVYTRLEYLYRNGSFLHLSSAGYCCQQQLAVPCHRN